MSKVLAIGDVHAPAAHPGYMSFVHDLYEQYDCDTVVFIGDLIDWHAISFHNKHPEAAGALDEYERAKAEIKLWRKRFPNAKVCIGNHDARIVRIAEDSGIPAKFIHDYKTIWETPTWEWKNDYIIDDVYYFHGTGSSGIHPAWTSMHTMLMSVVQGHIHTAFGVKWSVNPRQRIFGMDTGCGIDPRAPAFAYAGNMKRRPVLGAGVILDQIPIPVPMPCGPGEKYNRSRFTKKGKKK